MKWVCAVWCDSLLFFICQMIMVPCSETMVAKSSVLRASTIPLTVVVVEFPYLEENSF
ncbi:hypothetical protein RchiOBHm_Chr2g0172591 [Rosa chinensis]|uniref:Uncharacterized protein n=1 Tax=Rosa chinensis TaxID=74649 RepID=A0A2P6S5M8_ROSCH|nr:hypothetical protein RchiOBHm_Chr2g0172591 [Rosa chinensis]